MIFLKSGLMPKSYLNNAAAAANDAFEQGSETRDAI
jgi:hypothetical protein